MPTELLTSFNFKVESLADLFLRVYFFVDEWYKTEGDKFRRPGRPGEISDPEVITIFLTGQLSHASEAGWHHFVKANYGRLFPKLPERSNFHKKCKNLMFAVEEFRRWIAALGGASTRHVIDDMPVPVCKYARAGRSERRKIETDGNVKSLFGYCAAKKNIFWAIDFILP